MLELVILHYFMEILYFSTKKNAIFFKFYYNFKNKYSIMMNINFRCNYY